MNAITKTQRTRSTGIFDPQRSPKNAKTELELGGLRFVIVRSLAFFVISVWIVFFWSDFYTRRSQRSLRLIWNWVPSICDCPFLAFFAISVCIVFSGRIFTHGDHKDR